MDGTSATDGIAGAAAGDAGGARAEPPITALLQEWSAGRREARDRLFELVYPELQRLARQHLARERDGISLAAGDLVHETYLKLTAQQTCDWHSRNQFFALAAVFLRRILVDHAKRNRRVKHGRGAVHLPLHEDLPVQSPPPYLDLLALDRALVELAEIQVIAARLVELRLFADLSFEDAADVLGVSRATVMRKWRFARAWLAQRLEGGR